MGNSSTQKSSKNYVWYVWFSYVAGMYKIFMYKYLAACAWVENGNAHIMIILYSEYLLVHRSNKLFKLHSITNYVATHGKDIIYKHLGLGSIMLHG